ncbi:MAG: hypothetical protein J7L64_06545 [Acidobacteria bacterium]|nr:hypothetical protein [Acidobacteriota bacterium]
MKRLNFLTCLSLFLLILSGIAFALENPKTAVVEFQNKTKWRTKGFESDVTELFIYKLNKTGHYELLPKEDVTNALKESGIAGNIYLRRGEAVALGKKLGARLVMTGKIEKMKLEERSANVRLISPQGGGGMPPNPPTDLERRKILLKCKIKVKVVDVEKNRVIWEGKKSGETAVHGFTTLRMKAEEEVNKKDIARLLNEVLDKIIKEIEKKTNYLRKAS